MTTLRNTTKRTLLAVAAMMQKPMPKIPTKTEVRSSMLDLFVALMYPGRRLS